MVHRMNDMKELLSLTKPVIFDGYHVLGGITLFWAPCHFYIGLFVSRTHKTQLADMPFKRIGFLLTLIPGFTLGLNWYWASSEWRRKQELAG